MLRNDPYKLEEAKYRVQRLAGESSPDKGEIKRLLGVIQDNTSAGDWSNNLFAGVAYFLIGDKDEGISCVEVNVDFGYEETVSKAILSEMKKGELDAFTLFALQRDIEMAIKKPQQPAEKPQTTQAELKQPEPKKHTSGKRRDLTRDEIIAITRKYGFVTTDEIPSFAAHALGIPEDTKILTEYHWSLVSSMYFAADKIYWIKGFFTKTGGSMSYDDLRNDPKMTYSYLQELFKDFPSEVVPTLMELKELD